MYFSDAYPQLPSGGNWFNPILEEDTQLFVDPFLIYKEASGPWVDAQDEMADYFQRGFELLAGHHQHLNSLQYRKTIQLMVFPEPGEFGLGFVSKGTRGAGTGKGFAKLIVQAMADAIEFGLSDLTHFEELGVLVERIGRDRISDITCNILKPKFIAYTQSVCREFDVPLVDLEVQHAKYDAHRKRWLPDTLPLPQNPLTGGPVLLTPWRFLRELPSLDANDWWNYVEPELRDDLNLSLGEKIDKVRIIEIARRHADLVRQWSDDRAENRQAEPYDVIRDPEGLHAWQAQTRMVAQLLPLEDLSFDESNIMDFVEKVNAKFRLFVEEQGGWRLLYNEDSGLPKRELAVQLLYKGVVQAYCTAYAVILDREVELGRGPVDFVFSVSARSRVLLEVKKMQNGKFWNGLEYQLVSYMNSDECDRGWFLAVRFGDTATQMERTRELQARTRTASRNTGFTLRSDWVDARPKLSASGLAEGIEGVRVSGDDPESFED